MKKLVLSLLLSAVAANVFGMDQQMVPCQQSPSNHTVGLIMAGSFLVGLSMYAGYKESQLKNKNTTVKTNNSGLFGFAMNIDFGSVYTLAPLIPAYFCFKYGFEQLHK